MNERKLAVLAIILLGCTLIMGCASVTYESKDGTKITYSRFMTTSEKLKVEVDGATAEVNGQEIDTKALKAIGAIVGAVR